MWFSLNTSEAENMSNMSDKDTTILIRVLFRCFHRKMRLVCAVASESEWLVCCSILFGVYGVCIFVLSSSKSEDWNHLSKDAQTGTLLRH